MVTKFFFIVPITLINLSISPLGVRGEPGDRNSIKHCCAAFLFDRALLNDKKTFNINKIELTIASIAHSRGSKLAA